MARETLPALTGHVRPHGKGYPFSQEHRDNCFRIELEMAVGYARQLLDRHAESDPYDTEIIIERRRVAAKAILDYVWALMSEKNVLEGEGIPSPALVAFDQELRPRRLRRIDPAH
jgi:hypothetical protein